MNRHTRYHVNGGKPATAQDLLNSGLVEEGTEISASVRVNDAAVQAAVIKLLESRGMRMAPRQRTDAHGVTTLMFFGKGPAVVQALADLAEMAKKKGN